MDQNRNVEGEAARASEGAPTGPIYDQARAAQAEPTGAPTQYVPPDPRAQGSYYGNGQPQGQWAPPQQGAPYGTQYPYAQQYARPQRRYGGGLLGPFILITIGVLFLLTNFNVVGWNVWGQLWRLWPLILVAIGLEFLFGRRNVWASLVILLVMVAAVVGFLYYAGPYSGRGWFESGPLTQASLAQPLGGATSASVELSTGVASLTVDGSGEASQLATGELSYYETSGKPTISSSMKGSTAQLIIAQSSRGGDKAFNFGDTGAPDWNIHLNPRIPINLAVNGGVGTSRLNLLDLQISTLTVESGVGMMDVILPASPRGTLRAKVKTGVGQAVLVVPAGVEARIRVDKGIGGLDVDSRFVKTGDYYQTPGYDSATNRLDIGASTGIGSLNVR